MGLFCVLCGSQGVTGGGVKRRLVCSFFLAYLGRFEIRRLDPRVEGWVCKGQGQGGERVMMDVLFFFDAFTIPSEWYTCISPRNFIRFSHEILGLKELSYIRSLMNLHSKTICTRRRIKLKVEQVSATWCQHLESFVQEDELIQTRCMLFDEKRNNSYILYTYMKAISLFLCSLRSKWLWIKIVMFMLYSVRMHAESMLEVLHMQNYIRLFGCSVFVSICHPPCTSETLQLSSSMCCYFESLHSPQRIY